MKLYLTIFSFVLLPSLILQAEEEAPSIIYNPSGSSADWNGTNGRTYFLEWTIDLFNWEFLPVINSGDGSAISQGFTSTEPKLFLRLKWTDLPDGGDADMADFDGDGIPNIFELTYTPQSDPFDQSDAGGDSDGDGLNDHWEQYYFGGLNLADPTAILGGDGLTNKDKSDLGLDPDVNYSEDSTSLKSEYTYDLVGRLLTSSGSLTANTLTYDFEGNILTSN